MEQSRDWRTYYQGQAVLCPGRLPSDRRHGPRLEPDRRQPCKRVFVRVGFGEIYRVRWLGDRDHPPPVDPTITTHRCRDCTTVFQVQVELIARHATG